MRDDLLTEDAYVEKLLAVAAIWRERAGGTTDPYRGDVMRRTAEELERTAARTKRQRPLCVSKSSSVKNPIFG